MKTTVSILDNDNLSVETLKQYLDQYSKESGVSFKVNIFSKGKNLIAGYGKGADIVFISLDTADIDGIEVAKKIRNIDQRVAIILMAKTSARAIEGYMVDACDFIVKHIQYNDFVSKIKKAFDFCERQSIRKVWIKGNECVAYIKPYEIYYIEVRLHYLTYHMIRGEIVSRDSMKQVEERLAQYYFVRINHSFLVNLMYVDAIKNDAIYLNGKELKISRSRKKEVVQKYISYVDKDNKD